MLASAQTLWALASKRPLLLNPGFGFLSQSVGGADADLIAGSAVIELKASSRSRIEHDDLRILVSYAVLATASNVAEIETVNVYQAFRSDANHAI
jgi:hypothetical protein